jgi:hypothetical protein
VGGSIENAKRAGSKISPQNLVSRYVSSDQSAGAVVAAKPWDRPLIPMHAESRRCLSSEKHLLSEHRNIPFRRVKNHQFAEALNTGILERSAWCSG